MSSAVLRGTRAGALLLLVLAVSCGGATTPPSAAAPATEKSPSFDQILSASKDTEYKVTFQLTATGQGKSFIGEQSWYYKQGKARFDLKSTIAGQSSSVAFFALPDGTFMCLGTGAEAQCNSVSSLETAPQQNPAAFYQKSLTAHPERFSGVPVGTRHIAEQHAHCYDVRSLAGTSGLADGRFCYSVQGVPLVLRVGAQTGQWSMEATSLSTTVPDSDFALPSEARIVGRP